MRLIGAVWVLALALSALFLVGATCDQSGLPGLQAPNPINEATPYEWQDTMGTPPPGIPAVDERQLVENSQEIAELFLNAGYGPGDPPIGSAAANNVTKIGTTVLDNGETEDILLVTLSSGEQVEVGVVVGPSACPPDEIAEELRAEGWPEEEIYEEGCIPQP